MKVVIAHNRYSSAQPSGENVMVDAEIAQLRAAGVEVVPFLRSSDEIGDAAGRAARRCCRSSPIYAPVGPARARRAARAEHGRTCCTCTTRTRCCRPGWSGPRTPTACRWCRRSTTTGTSAPPRRSSATGTICRDCVGKRFPTPAIKHKCYRGSTAQIGDHGDHAGRAPGHLALGRPVRRADLRHRRLPARLRHRRRPDLDQAERDRRTRARPRPIGDGFLFVGRLSAGEGRSACCSTRGAGTRTARSARCGSSATARCATLVEAAAAERADIAFDGPRRSDGGTRRPCAPPPS